MYFALIIIESNLKNPTINHLLSTGLEIYHITHAILSCSQWNMKLHFPAVSFLYVLLLLI